MLSLLVLEKINWTNLKPQSAEAISEYVSRTIELIESTFWRLKGAENNKKPKQL